MQRTPVAWISDNRLVAAGVAFLVLAAAITFALLSGPSDITELSKPGPTVDATAAPSKAKGDEPASGKEKRSSGTVSAPGYAPGGSGVIPGVDGPGVDGKGATRACTAKKVTEVGVSDSSISIGQVVTDSNQIPQQFRPAHEGLAAFIKLYNRAGGLCGRTIELDYRNDQLNPAIHTSDMRDLANKSLAFVANESVLDQLDYGSSPPFEPNFEGGGSRVPDVGGLAFSYARGQSAWHAGVVGSVSPVLVGGAQYRFYIEEAKAASKPCTDGAVLYLQEPTGASEDQARLGAASLEAGWGGNLGSGHTRLYSASLLDNDATYAAIVQRMADDGMNCVFTYTDLQSSVRLAKAMRSQGLWPPSTACTRCFRVAHIPLSAYDPKFVTDAGQAAVGFSTFIPHVPLNESSSAAMTAYLEALKAIPGARPSTFSILGFASGAMFVTALQPCAAAPTRACLMNSLRKLRGFTADGLLGGTSPFQTTRANYDDYGTFDWKWIFSSTVGMRVMDRSGKRDFYRINPKAGFFKDTLKIARGSAA